MTHDIPGPSAGISALALSGFPTRRFCFEGFLPQEKKSRTEVMEDLKRETRTILLYEAPHRLIRTLEMLLAELGNREISICREITKKHEHVSCSTIEALLEHYREYPPKGECVLVIKGMDRSELQQMEQEVFFDLPIELHLKQYLEQGLDEKEAMRRVAKDRGIRKRDVYQAIHVNQ